MEKRGILPPKKLFEKTIDFIPADIAIIQRYKRCEESN